MGAILSKKAMNIDNIYRVYFNSDRTMLSDKRRFRQEWWYNYKWKNIHWNTKSLRIDF